MAQEIGYGQSHGLSTSPMVIKATMMNSADPVFDKVLPSDAGNPPNLTPPSLLAPPCQQRGRRRFAGRPRRLDTDSGAGQINGARLYQQYSAGQQVQGFVNTIGWDLGSISGVATNTYTINAPQAAGSQINVSLDWLRHVDWTDSNLDHIANGGDLFFAHTLDDLNLSVLINGSLVAESISTTDNEEFLQFVLPQSGTVSIQVDELAVAGAPMAETYGLAWNVTAVPEPPAIVLAACAATVRRSCADYDRDAISAVS